MVELNSFSILCMGLGVEAGRENVLDEINSGGVEGFENRRSTKRLGDGGDGARDRQKFEGGTGFPNDSVWMFAVAGTVADSFLSSFLMADINPWKNADGIWVITSLASPSGKAVRLNAATSRAVKAATPARTYQR
jgi:hypothetical protein